MEPLPWRQWDVPVADFSYREFIDETGLFPLPGQREYFLLTLSKLSARSLASVFLSTRMLSSYGAAAARLPSGPQTPSAASGK